MTASTAALSLRSRWRTGFLLLATTAVLGAGTAVGVHHAAAAPACGAVPGDAEAVRTGNTWTSRNGTRGLYTGTDMLEAMRRAVASLTPRRTAKQRIVVRGSGSMPADQSLDLPNYTILEVCGTVNVTGRIGSGNAVARIKNAHDVDVPYLNVTGSPYFGIFIQNSSNVHLGQISVQLGAAGLGIRVDNLANRRVRATNISMDSVFASGGNSHGVETYGVDGLTIGTVTARDTAHAGLLLNDTINATIGTVDAIGAGTDTGYAAFRMANRNGRIGNAYPTNIRVGTVKARGGGRGIFCVSESGGVVIDTVDIAQTGSNAILIENCHGVTIAAKSGTVRDKDVRVASRATFPVSSDVNIQNLTVTNSSVSETPCGRNIAVRNVTRVNAPLKVCSGTQR